MLNFNLGIEEILKHLITDKGFAMFTSNPPTVPETLVTDVPDDELEKSTLSEFQEERSIGGPSMLDYVIEFNEHKDKCSELDNKIRFDMFTIKDTIESINKNRLNLVYEYKKECTTAAKAVRYHAKQVKERMSTLRRKRKGKELKSLMIIDTKEFYFGAQDGSPLAFIVARENTDGNTWSSSFQTAYYLGLKTLGMRKLQESNMVQHLDLTPSILKDIEKGTIKLCSYPYLGCPIGNSHNRMTNTEFAAIRAFYRSDFNDLDLLPDNKLIEYMDNMHEPIPFNTRIIE